MASQVKPELVVARDIASAAAERFLALRPRFLALAGGSTPRRLYERLATCDFPWSETEVFFSDERCVPPEHPDSNYRMAHEALLSRVRARVHRMPGETCGAAAYEEELTSVFGPGLPEFDLVLLGLGEDGHTASLFPGDPALERTDRRVVRVQRPDHPRLTLTLPVLSAAKVAMFLVSGESKREPLRLLLTGGDVPAARVTARYVVIFADEAAVGRPVSPRRWALSLTSHPATRGPLHRTARE
jgi:6-phosphogluconolactonase